ncbi:PH domain-containing protein [Halegenticoccus soli]|uniref:PH domain-containing protein n=1 Tax=Halegenticoccus soli TaxID=1985678 RepID=UPI000C6D5C8A|nr:PH domain-containing protein [Halegenticoccus soli]
MSADESWLWLREGEEVRWRGRPRLARVLPAVGVGLAVVAAAAGLAALVDPLALALAAFGLLPPLAAALRVTNTAFVLTGRTLWIKTGVLGRSVRRVPLSLVQNTASRQSVRGSLFGYGTVVAEVAGGPDAVLVDVPDPREVRELIDDGAVNRGEKKEVPGSVDQWREVLAAVRRIRIAIEMRNRAGFDRASE